MLRVDRLPVGRRWLREIVILIILTVAVWLALHIPGAYEVLYDQLKDRRYGVYGDLLGIHASPGVRPGRVTGRRGRSQSGRQWCVASGRPTPSGER